MPDSIDLRSFRCETTACEFLFEHLYGCLTSRRAGMAIVSPPRCGLSVAIQRSVSGLRKQFSKMPVYCLSAYSHPDPRPGHAWARLFSLITQSRSIDRDPIALRYRTQRYIAMEALENQESQALIVVDKAHALNASDYAALTTLQDDLRTEGIALTVCLAGYKHLLSVRDELFATGDYEPAVRYLTQVEKFFGIRNTKDLVYFLTGFDYRMGANAPSVSEEQCPGLWKSDWRLAHETPRAWAALCEYADTDTGVETAFVFDAICHFLEANHESNPAHAPSSDAWSVAVSRTELHAYRKFMHDLKSPKGRHRG